MRKTNRQEAVPIDTDTFPITEDGMSHADDAAESSTASAAVHTIHPRQTRAQEKSRQMARIRRMLIACGFSVLYLIALSVFYSLDLVGRSTFAGAIVAIVGAMLLLLVIFASGINRRFAEKSLTGPIVLAVVVTMLCILNAAPSTRTIFTPFVFVAIAYGMYRLAQRTMLILSIGTLIGYGAVVGLHYVRFQDGAMLKLELLHLMVLVLTIPGFIMLTARVQRLHDALKKAGMKIRNIEESARRDSLTDCYNRRYMVAVLEEQKRLADDNGTPLCLAVIDLDHFKRINDEVGHLAGDEVLRTFARVAQDNVRQGDVFGRYGGEEFLLVLPETSLLAALNTAERIREQVEHYQWSNTLHGLVTVSIGLTQYIAGESVLDLFSRTDTAMYLAKRGGRNQVVVEEPTVELWQAEEAI